MSQHTPGPWRWREFLGNYSLRGDFGARPVVLVADIDGGPSDWDPPGGPVILARGRETGALEPLTPDHPDARLIAAAPDLLAALEDILAMTNLRGSGNPMEAKAVAAVAKAKGVTP